MRPAPYLAALFLFGCAQKHHSMVPVVVSAHSRIYHLAQCRYVKRIKTKLEFKDIELAKLGNRYPCKVCRPGEK